MYLPFRIQYAEANKAVIVDDDLNEYEEYSEYEEEEILDEEYDEEEIIEEYDDDEYEEIEIPAETHAEAKHREQLEAEIAMIEQQIADAKSQKEKRITEEGGGETAKEKAQRMAQASRLQEAKQRKVENDFKRRAAARAKVLAEKEAGWGKKGKKKQKDLSEIIASKAKKQKKLLSRQKSKDYAKQPIKPKPKEEAKVEHAPKAEEKKELSLADMVARKQVRGPSATAHIQRKAETNENQRADDDYGDGLRPEDFLPSDDSEDEAEEEEVLSPEEQRRRQLEWEKPTWTQAKLKTTVKGTQVKKGRNLAGEITHVKKKINDGLEEDDDEEQASAGAAMHGAIKMVMLPKTKKAHSNLKFTVNGSRIRDGRAVEAPINSKMKKEEIKIWGADPEELRLTPRGLTARKGKQLEEEGITLATQTKKYQFEKPDWAKSRKVKHTEAGETLASGQDLTEGATMATQNKKYEFERPQWLNSKLKSTDTGSKLKEGGNLAKPIVVLDRKAMNVNLEANPAFLKMTDQGERLMDEGNLARPITELPEMMKRTTGRKY